MSVESSINDDVYEKRVSNGAWLTINKEFPFFSIYVKIFFQIFVEQKDLVLGSNGQKVYYKIFTIFFK